MIVKATNKVTGEVWEYSVKELPELFTAYSAAQEYEKMAKSIKDQLKDKIDELVDDNGRSPEYKGKQFKRITVQRQTYDKAVLREVLDEDTYDLMLKPEKAKVDKYIAENLEALGDDSTKLRQSMIEDGKPYTMYRLEKLEREVSNGR